MRRHKAAYSFQTDWIFTGWLTQLAEELVNTGASRVGSVQIDFGLEDDINPNRVGLVYVVDIPPKATILSASIQFLSDLRLFDPVNLEITGHKTANAPLCSLATNDLLNRPRTTAKVTWSVPGWLSGEQGPNQVTPDLETIIQELVNLPGWASGNKIMLLFEEPVVSNNDRRANTAQGAPLSINWQDRKWRLFYFFS